jgi:anti-sigma regulatory factor (Ser/Thr protein kinase)
LVSNSVRHSKECAEVLLTVTAANGAIRIEVSDQGPCFDWNGPRGDGMGLAIIDKIATDCGVTNDDLCTAWVEMRSE